MVTPPSKPQKPTSAKKSRSVMDLKGIVPKPARPVTIEEMNRAIRERAARSK